MRLRAAQWPLVALAALFAGCATDTPTKTPTSAPSSTSPASAPRKVTQQPVARYNLSGYSPAFKQGYGDACAGRRNDQRYKTDVDYQMGWSDGRSLCRAR